MANDRIFLKCRHCGDCTMLAKYYPTIGHGIWNHEKLDEWVDKHMQCSPHFGEIDLKGDRCFDLFSESDSRFKELYVRLT